jgi:hypothetical protein
MIYLILQKPFIFGVLNKDLVFWLSSLKFKIIKLWIIKIFDYLNEKKLEKSMMKKKKNGIFQL